MIFEIDFEGNQTNVQEYEKQIMDKGSVCDKLWFYSTKPDDLKFNHWQKYIYFSFYATTFQKRAGGESQIWRSHFWRAVGWAV